MEIFLESKQLTPYLHKKDNTYEIVANILSKDMGEELAICLVENLKGEKEDIFEEDLVKFYEKTAELWTPLLIHFTNWIHKNSGNVPVKFAMRDGEPFSIIYNLLYPGNNDNLIWINRKVCGIKTEDKSEGALKKAELLFSYIEQEGLNKDFMFVDAGCWGTIIKNLYSVDGLNFQGKPLFFYSHNPNIPSFLKDVGVSESFGEILNDSLESFFPKKYKSVECFEEKEQKIVPYLVNNEDIMVKCNEAFNKKLSEEVLKYKSKQKDLPNIQDTIKLMQYANEFSKKGEFTGVLKNSTPGTVNKEIFLATWPKDLNWTKDLQQSKECFLME